MKIYFEEKDMIEFVKWYDSQNEDNLSRTFKEDFDKWLSLKESTQNSNYAECPRCCQGIFE